MNGLELADGMGARRGKGTKVGNFLRKGSQVVKKGANLATKLAPDAAAFIPGGGVAAKGLIRVAKTPAGQRLVKFAATKGGKLITQRAGDVGKGLLVRKINGKPMPSQMGLVKAPATSNSSGEEDYGEKTSNSIQTTSTSTETKIFGLSPVTAAIVAAGALFVLSRVNN